MGIGWKSVEKMLHVFVDQGVFVKIVAELLQFFFIWQFSMNQQVSDLYKCAVSGKAFDIITPVHQKATVSIHIGYVALAYRGVGHTVIVGHKTGEFF
jgi:hypothetical protein